jgi:hypothetical protein
VCRSMKRVRTWSSSYCVAVMALGPRLCRVPSRSSSCRRSPMGTAGSPVHGGSVTTSGCAAWFARTTFHVEDLMHRGGGHEPSVSSRDLGCRMGRVRAAAGGEGGTLRPSRGDGVSVVAVVEGPVGSVGTWWTPWPLTVREWFCSECGARHDRDHRRRQEHPRRRACGEAKRLWSRCQSCLRRGRT